MTSGADATATAPGLDPGAASGPIRLEPSSDCRHPSVHAACENGECRIEPGCFVMGAPRDELGAGRYSNIQVQVTLSRSFLMGQTEVTNEEWASAGWGLPQRDIPIGNGTCREPRCPVTNVTFFDAIRYANWRSEQAGLPVCYALDGCTGEVGLDLSCTSVTLTAPSAYECRGYRLPMEAEWEYAARAGTRSAFYSGDILGTELGECTPEPALDASAWYCRNAGGRAHPVAQKTANGWGLQDTLGNVFEWCNDYCDGLGYGDGPFVDPAGRLATGTSLLPERLPNGEDGRSFGRVVRGGAYELPGDSLTVADRGTSLASNTTSGAVGFRLARSAPP